LNYSGEVRVRNEYRHGEVETHTAIPITKADFAKINGDYKGTRISADGTHKVRTTINALIPALKGTFGGDDNKRHGYSVVYISDAKQHPRPGADAANAAAVRDQNTADEVASALDRRAAERLATRKARKVDPDAAKFQALKEAAKTGVAVVSVPQLFPTPADVARRMVEAAELSIWHRILEPSAGTGRLIEAVKATGLGFPAPMVAVEVSGALAKNLLASWKDVDVRNADFLKCNGDLGKFDRILMNPPFHNAADIEHILHALHMLRPAGRLVGICADGPRQREKLKPLASVWEELPAGTFAGTDVRAALFVINA
jgi:SAM-dependent methyltransferase